MASGKQICELIWKGVVKSNEKLIFTLSLQFFPYPNYGKFTIAGESFNLMDGLLAMSITKTPLKLGDSDRSLLFHALASGTENAVQLGVLNNSTLWQNNVQAAPEEFRMIGSRGIQTGGKLNSLSAVKIEF